MRIPGSRKAHPSGNNFVYLKVYVSKIITPELKQLYLIQGVCYYDEHSWVEYNYVQFKVYFSNISTWV